MAAGLEVLGTERSRRASDGLYPRRNFEARRSPTGGPGLVFSFFPGAAMTAWTKTFRRLWSDEAGGEVIEYALVLGLIIVAAIAIIGTVGVKVAGKWSSVDNSL